MNKRHNKYPWVLLFILLVGAIVTLLFGTVGGAYVMSIMLFTFIVASFFR